MFNSSFSDTFRKLSLFSFLNSRWERFLFHILFLSGSSFLWAVRAAKSDISSYMPLRRVRNTVFLQFLGPLNAEREPRTGLSAQRLTVSFSLLSARHRSLELIEKTEKRLLSDRPWWQGLPLPAGCDLGHHQTQHATGWIHFDEMGFFLLLEGSLDLFKLGCDSPWNRPILVTGNNLHYSSEMQEVI